LNKKVDSRGSPDLVDSRSTKSGMEEIWVNNYSRNLVDLFAYESKYSKI
jgi:hypothetical protein